MKLKDLVNTVVKVNFGQRPWDARAMVPVSSYETWLRYQAHSLLGRPASLEEAVQLFERIDINSRLEKSTHKELSPWQKFWRNM